MILAQKDVAKGFQALIPADSPFCLDRSLELSNWYV